MQKIIIVLFLVICCFFINAEDNEIDKILKQIDTVNQFSDIYTAKIQIAYFEPDKEPFVTTYELYARGIKMSLLITRKPEKDEGKKILLNNDKIWFYFPKLKKAIVMNPTNTLFGSVSIGDVMTPPVLDIYDFESAKKKMSDGKEVMELVFNAKTRKAPYGKVVYHYHNKQIVYSESYTRSGILLKQAYFTKFIKNAKGIEYATNIKMVNAIYPKYYSLMKISDLKEVKSIPDYYFIPDGLEKVK